MMIRSAKFVLGGLIGLLLLLVIKVLDRHIFGGQLDTYSKMENKK